MKKSSILILTLITIFVVNAQPIENSGWYLVPAHATLSGCSEFPECEGLRAFYGYYEGKYWNLLEKENYENFKNRLPFDGGYPVGAWMYLDERTIGSEVIYEKSRIRGSFNPLYTPLEDIELEKGWNMLVLTQLLLGKTFLEDETVYGGKSFFEQRGTCTFSNIYSWDVKSQSWQRESDKDTFKQEDLNSVRLVKVAEDCALGTYTSEPEPLPSLPENECGTTWVEESCEYEVVQAGMYEGGAKDGCPYYICCGDGTCASRESEYDVCSTDCS